MPSRYDETLPLPTPTRLGRELRLRKPPMWLAATAMILAAASLIPIGLIFRARVTFGDQPRLHGIQDMDNQVRFGSQDASTVRYGGVESSIFADGRAMRTPPPGTAPRSAVFGGVAPLSEPRGLEPGEPGVTRTEPELYAITAAPRGLGRGRDALLFGYDRDNIDPETGAPVFVTDYPEELLPAEPDARQAAARALVARGRDRYNVYCATCHGYDGYGQGPTHLRAAELRAQDPAANPWVNPTSIHDAAVRERSVGYLYNVVRNGIRNMPGYGSQIPVRDRWAVVLYLRALQEAEQMGPGVEPVEPDAAAAGPDADPPTADAPAPGSAPTGSG